MKKYLQTFKLALQKAFTYKSIEFIWVISAFLTPFLLMTLWSQNHTDKIEGFNLSEIVTYYFVMTFVIQLVSPHINWNVANDINNGTLAFYLVKPYKYFIQLFIQEIAWKIIAYICVFFPLLLFAFIYRSNIVIPSMNLQKVMFIIVLCISSYLLMFLVEFTLGILAFWVTQINAFFRIFYMSNDLFAGKFFPLILMPNILKAFGKFLPFQYFWYFPTMIIMGKSTQIDIRFGIITIFLWIIIFVFLAKLLWIKGIKKYSSYGG